MMLLAPFYDRQGRFSPLKTSVFVGVLLPAFWLAYQGMNDQLGAKPITAALHETGIWALRLLLAALAITPIRLITRQNRLIAVRRMLGVGALAYALLHFGLYTVQMKLDFGIIAREIALRFYLTIGFVSLLAMMAMGATSTDAAVRRLGSARWGRLHKLVFPLTVLALLHAYIQAKIDVSQEVVMSGIFLALVGVRLLRGRFAFSAVNLSFLALSVALAALAIEYAWYALATGVPAARILAANFDYDLAPRPALLVLMFAASLPILSFAFRLYEERATPRLNRNERRS